jgi:hypothetical protein
VREGENPQVPAGGLRKNANIGGNVDVDASERDVF